MVELDPNIKSVTAFAPATCANVAVGFDLLGFPIQQVGDKVTLSRINGDIQIELESSIKLPLDPDKNIASFVIKKLCQANQLPINFKITIQKGIPIGSGMGGSAASAVSALVALNGFLKEPLTKETLARYAIDGEAMISGSRHADNVVPCLLGGMTLTRRIDPLEVIQLPLPNLYCVLVHPALRVNTKRARAILPKEFPLKTYVQQSANLASFISALYQNNNTLIGDCLQDILIEPWRSKLVKGFDSVKKTALQAGALGASLSGSGPSLFALAETNTQAQAVKEAMMQAFAAEGIDSQGWLSRISERGAYEVKKN